MRRCIRIRGARWQIGAITPLGRGELDSLPGVLGCLADGGRANLGVSIPHVVVVGPTIQFDLILPES